MDLEALAARALGRVDPRVLAKLYAKAKKVPWVREKLDEQYGALMEGMEAELKPYKHELRRWHALPSEGLPREEILAEMEELNRREEDRWREGYVSGAVYHGDEAHIDFLNRVYALHSQVNPLHTDLWPSATKYEAEIVSMTARMLGGDEDTCGVVSSGGTESILLAMKAYRDQAHHERGIRHPQMILPVTAHAAFDKASQYFRIKAIKVPVGEDMRARVKAVKRAINRNTAVIVGSAPAFPHGVVDPIEELSELARQRGIGFHTDACLGGFVLPWAEKLGYPVPPFDFRLPGVTSISADTHKYGYAAKGTSVVMYRSQDLLHHQFYKSTDWPGGLYFSPTFAGSRPGALSAACWASLLSVGEQGYLDATRAIMEAATTIKQGIGTIPQLRVLGDPLWVIAFASDELDIYRVMEQMTHKGWSLNGLHRPACVHIAVTLRHTQLGVAERFVQDLRDSAAYVEAHPSEQGSTAPVYGMAASMPVRGLVADMLERYMDLLYKV